MKYLDEKGLLYFWNKIKAKMPTPLDFYPVGSIYMSVKSANPGTIFGGTWVAWGSGRVPVGVDTTQSEFNKSEATGGKKTHKLTVDEMPEHRHDYNNNQGAVRVYDTSGALNWPQDGPYPNSAVDRFATTYAGGSQPHNNLQPYITCYMWKRTA
jgi:microcystin-dependent protein